ncbi:hypothetical protein IRJ41_020930, partial [Triplophysa rosa]
MGLITTHTLHRKKLFNFQLQPSASHYFCELCRQTVRRQVFNNHLQIKRNRSPPINPNSTGFGDWGWTGEKMTSAQE